MISNQILQNTLDGLKEITRLDISVLNTQGKTLAATLPEMEKMEVFAPAFVMSEADSQTFKGYQFFKIFDDNQPEYVLVVADGDDAHMVGKLAAFQIQNLMVAYKERFDKDNFIKNLLLDNLLLVDIYNRAKKLRIETEARRLVILLETAPDKETAVVEEMRTLWEERPRDFITTVDEKSIILVRELEQEESDENIQRMAAALLSSLRARVGGVLKMAYGTPVQDIREVSRSYKEAKLALDVGKIFFEERDIVAYGSLGIGRLIYQLPIPLCKMFIREIFGEKSPDQFDKETFGTINKFFENSLNVSETSRQLYIHRNTLVYRLDKLQKQTGLDIRTFEDAITFRIALMVVKYMRYMETEE